MIELVLLGYAVRSVAVLALAALVIPRLRKHGAALRHRAWAVAVAALVTLPLATELLPTCLRLPLPAITEDTPPPHPGSTARALSGTEPAAQLSGAMRAGTLPARPADAAGGRQGPSLAGIVLAAWIGGGLVVLLRIVTGLAARHRLWRVAARVASDGALAAALRDAAATLGVRRAVTLYTSTSIAVPVTWGFFTPSIVLPGAPDAAWRADRLRSVLLHELAHVVRADATILVAARVVIALHWWNPLAWFAGRRLAAEAEHAADDRVLLAGVAPSCYAEHLLEVARELRAGAEPPSVAVAMARPRPASALERRLRAIVAEGRPRLAGGRTANGIVLVLAALALIPLATTGCSHLGATHSLTESSDDAPRGYFADPRFAGQCAGGWLGRRHVLGVREFAGGEYSISLVDGGCRLKIDGDDRVQLLDESVGRVASGAAFEAVEKSGLGTRRVRVTPGADGKPAFSYSSDDRPKPWGDEANAFLAGVVREIHRSTVVGIDERIARLYAAGGIDAVLHEVEQVSSGTIRHAYLAKLVESGKLGPSELTRTLAAATRLVNSSYERSQVLKSALDAWPKDAALPAEFFASITSLGGDYERSRLVQAVAAERPLIDAERLAVIGAIDSIGSDYERGQALHAFIRRRAPLPAELPALLAAAKHIGSEYDRAQVLHQVLESRPVTDAEAASLVDAIRSIGSGYERSQLLVQLAGRHALGGPALDAYVAVAQQIGSEYERNQALAAPLGNRP